MESQLSVLKLWQITLLIEIKICGIPNLYLVYSDPSTQNQAA